MTTDAELCAQVARVEGWQPIETAPKDGSHMLLYRPEFQFVGYWATVAKCWVINAQDLPVMYPLPTHWQPLLEPPAVIEAHRARDQ